MAYKRGRYSWLMKPFLVFFDLLIINILAYYFFSFNIEKLHFFASGFFNNKQLLFLIYSILVWVFSTVFISFYKVYRYTSALNILSLLIKQFLIFSILVYAFIGLFRSINTQAFVTFKYIILTFVIIGFLKFVSYYLLRAYRLKLNGNIRRVVIIGDTDSANELRTIFLQKKELGYKLLAHFSNSKSKNITGNIKESFKFLQSNDGIDEIYCAIEELSESQINDFVKCANIHHCNIKFIPEKANQLTKRLKTDFYNYLPILSIQQVAINHDFNKLVKRAFDVLFSIVIIVFIVSWVSFILFILIKLESKGPLFYKHKRNGLNYKEFTCYKFRSLRTIKEIKGTYVQLNDKRVTKIGKFLRQTSIDELPQFINVLFGDMSVVGPRPHMLSYTEDYSKKIDKYNFIFRHHVKPGITGLAQIKGFRGEIKNDDDIINRIEFDNFYIENWSLLLDIKIIIQTILHVFKGQKQAY